MAAELSVRQENSEVARRKLVDASRELKKTLSTVRIPTYTFNHNNQGRLSPNKHDAIPPILTSYSPLFICHSLPSKQFLDIVYAILCNFMRVFSEFW